MKAVTFDEVVSSWLKDEWHYDVYSDLRKDKRIQKLVTHPNLKNSEDNKERLKVLLTDRKSIISKIPKDTIWYSTKLNFKLLNKLYVIHTNWCKTVTQKSYRLTDVSVENLKQVDSVHLKRVTSILKSKKVYESKMIFFGSNPKEPLTVIEGNHRAIANILSYKKTKQLLNSHVYIGISKSASTSKLSHEFYQ